MKRMYSILNQQRRPSVKKEIKALGFLVLILMSLPAWGQGTAALQRHCFLGGKQASTQGTKSANYQQGIIPACTVTVYLTGTQTKATIYNASGVEISNPFTANAAYAVDPGGWIFWAAVNQGYDIVM